ncbi:hypothetical protein Bcon01_77410 [Burkholderia contaminans]|jgi:hypothetical protein|nr:hypothetical protein Bcon01_77410 [Burkholderia contaminans]
MQQAYSLLSNDLCNNAPAKPGRAAPGSLPAHPCGTVYRQPSKSLTPPALLGLRAALASIECVHWTGLAVPFTVSRRSRRQGRRARVRACVLVAVCDP